MLDINSLDPIISKYLAIIFSLLVFGGLVLALLGRSGRQIHSMWLTYKGWLIMAPIVATCLTFGRIPTICLVGAISIWSFKEFARATGLFRSLGMTSAVYLCLSILVVIAILPDPNGKGQGWFGLFNALPVFAISIILLIPIAQNRFKGQLQTISLSILGFIYLGWLFGHLSFLANSQKGMLYIFYLILAVEINDVSAFVFGKLLGKTPLVSNISPNKTVEGAMGAMAVSFMLPWVFQFGLPGFSWLHLCLTGFIVSAGSLFGDLTISLIKRDIGIKDMGNAIPGHGGILDRVDSLIFVAPLFFHMVRWFGLL